MATEQCSKYQLNPWLNHLSTLVSLVGTYNYNKNPESYDKFWILDGP